MQFSEQQQNFCQTGTSLLKMWRNIQDVTDAGNSGRKDQYLASKSAKLKGPKNSWVDDAFGSVSQQTSLKGSDQTFYGTVFVVQKTCVTSLCFRSIPEKHELMRQPRRQRRVNPHRQRRRGRLSIHARSKSPPLLVSR
jgi:hypothetical protein